MTFIRSVTLQRGLTLANVSPDTGSAAVLTAGLPW